MILVLFACAAWGLIVPTCHQVQVRIIQDIPHKASPRAETDLPICAVETFCFVGAMQASFRENVRLLQIFDMDPGNVAAASGKLTIRPSGPSLNLSAACNLGPLDMV